MRALHRPVQPFMPRTFTLGDFDFALPPELIAQHPADERSASRLLDGREAQAVDRVFRELPALLEPGDLLVFNDTRVIKARLLGVKATGGSVEALVERVLPNHEVLAHLRASKSPKPGSWVRFADAFDAEVLGRAPDGRQLYFAFGHQHLGMTLAGITARIIVAQVMGRDPGIDMAPYAPDRF